MTLKFVLKIFKLIFASVVDVAMMAAFIILAVVQLKFEIPLIGGIAFFCVYSVFVMWRMLYRTWQLDKYVDNPEYRKTLKLPER